MTYDPYSYMPWQKWGFIALANSDAQHASYAFQALQFRLLDVLL